MSVVSCQMLVTSSTLNTKTGEVENKILNRDVYKNTREFNKLTSENFADKLKQAQLVSKNYIADFVKHTDFDVKLKTLIKK